MSVYDYSVRTPGGESIPLSRYAGKVILIVNTATGCGFTPQYKDLEAMYEAFHDRGLEIIDVPCNQFYGQAPGSDEEIHEFCTLHYHTKFPQMKKSLVNGEDAIPLYKYLKTQKGFEGFSGPKKAMMDKLLSSIDADYKNNSEIKWNFTKFVVDRSGTVVARFEPTEDMKVVSAFVEKLL